ncbi:hypothetical protein KW794_01575 [Candidatus Saccharibacteria bacterium]|nr:hypothetical protein [Candidatus Saccharibacteria bacterium]
MTNHTSESSLTDLTFLQSVYRHHGIFTYASHEEVMSNHDETSQIADKLLKELEHRGRGDFPKLEIPDPGQRLESLTVRLAVISFEAIKRENLLEPLYPADAFREYKKADVDARLIYKEDEPDGHTAGSLTVTGHEKYSTVEGVRLDRYIGERAVSGHSPRTGVGIQYDYEAMNFLRMVGTYLTALEESEF